MIIKLPPPWVIWFISGVLLMIIEIFTPAFFSLIIGIACILTGIAAIFINNLIFQFIFFCITLVLLMIFLRPIFLKYFAGKNVKHSNVDALIGKEAIVTEEINNIKKVGYIKIGADYLKAVSKDGNVIPKNKTVIIEKIEGITAAVSLKK